MNHYIIGIGGVGKSAKDICKEGILTESKDLALKAKFYFTIAFGINYMKERKFVWESLIKDGTKIPKNIIGGWVSPQAKIGKGNIILNNSTVAHSTEIMDNNFIGYNTDIDHNVLIRNHNYISPGVTICSYVKIGDLNMIGAGATIIPEVKIGYNCVIGAGAVVLRDIKDYEVVIGNPARRLSKMEQIRFNWPKYPQLSEIEPTIRELLTTGQVTNGKYVKVFEERVAEFCGSKYGIGTSSCSSGLNILLSTLPKGTEVIIPALTFVATYEAVKWNNLNPVIVDVNESGLIDVESVEKSIGNKASAVLAVNLYAQDAYSKELHDLCAEKKIKLFFDSAPLFQEKFFKGDAQVLSFGPTKVLATLGEAGMILTNSEELFNTLKLKRTHGHSGNLLSEVFGTNARQSEIMAIVGLEQLKGIKEQMDERLKIYEKFKNLLKDFDCLPVSSKSIKEFVILTEFRDELEKYLNDNGISTKRYYPSLNMVPTVEEKAETPVADQIASRCLALPFHLFLDDTQITYICDKVNEFFKNKK